MLLGDLWPPSPLARNPSPGTEPPEPHAPGTAPLTTDGHHRHRTHICELASPAAAVDSF